MIDDEKQHMIDRLNEIEDSLFETVNIILDIKGEVGGADEPGEVTPESDERALLPDDTPVGHGWIMGVEGIDLFKPDGDGRFTWWVGSVWGNEGNWSEADLPCIRPATVGDLRSVGLPITEWPDITAPEPKPEVESEAMTENVVYELAKVPGSAGFIVKHEGEIYYAFYDGAWIPALDWQACQPRIAVAGEAWRYTTSDPLGYGVHNWAKP